MIEKKLAAIPPGHVSTAATTEDVSGAASGCTLPAEVEEKIATNLRQHYDQLLAEPIPDKFKGLLDQLAKLERKE